jgi:hypothetical protein
MSVNTKEDIRRTNMKVLELFSGTSSFSNEAKKRGHDVVTVDNDKRFNPSKCISIMDLQVSDEIGFYKIKKDFDIVWASPPCTCFSVASIGYHWMGGYRNYIPRTDEAIKSIRLVEKTIEIIKKLEPVWFFIENPRGVLRKLNLIPFPLKTCCYCQYGDTRMKPTDIWTNLASWIPKMCHNGSKDHQSAPRGSRAGTQGLKDSIERSRVPEQLCKELLELIEKEV